MEACDVIRKSGRSASGIWSELDASYFNAAYESEPLSFEYVGALKFLTNALAMYGILSSISIGPEAPFSDYRQLVEQSGIIQLEQITGCQNWVMLAILEVGALDKWKREETENRRLSMKTLARRAMDIEMLVENGLKESSGNPVIDLTTSIYATSVLTYMHTVVSGLNPNLTEVQDSVTTTINLMHQIQDAQMVKNLAWPLAVTGCMASKEQEDFFKTLANSAGIHSGARGLRNCWVLPSLWERTWKMRDMMTTSPPTRWEDLINGVGPAILLV